MHARKWTGAEYGDKKCERLRELYNVASSNKRTADSKKAEKSSISVDLLV